MAKRRRKSRLNLHKWAKTCLNLSTIWTPYKTTYQNWPGDPYHWPTLRIKTIAKFHIKFLLYAFIPVWISRPFLVCLFFSGILAVSEEMPFCHDFIVIVKKCFTRQLCHTKYAIIKANMSLLMAFNYSSWFSSRTRKKSTKLLLFDTRCEIFMLLFRTEIGRNSNAKIRKFTIEK